MKTHYFLLAGLLGFSSAAFADDDEDDNHDHHHVSWSYLKLTDVQYDMDVLGIDIEPEGYGIELALSFGDHLFGTVSRSRAEGDEFGIDYDFDTEAYGFGWHWDSWYASYTYNTWEVDSFETDVDSLRVGFRDMWSDWFEFNASYTWNDIEDADNDDGFQVGFAYRLWEGINLTADYETIGGDLDIDRFMIGVRLDF